MAKFDNWNNIALSAQCVFPRLNIDLYASDSAYNAEIKQLAKIGCGGFCVFQGNSENVRSIVAELQMLADVPLLFCSDFENGLQMRLEDGTSFPHSNALAVAGQNKFAATNKKEDETAFTEQIAEAIAKEARNIGILWNLAPVCDINSNLRNPVINIRSFGKDKEIVKKHIKSYIYGTQSQNVVACAKHFPGHGDTDVDSHSDFPILSKDVNDLYADELVPFIDAISEGVRSIMIGHLIVNAFDSKMPASLSKAVINNFLRNQLHYDGVILTDGLDMRSIIDKYSTSEIAEFAINAGNDILLIPQNPIETITCLSTLLDKQKELREQLLASVNRIYNLKVWTKLIPRFAAQENGVKLFTEHLNLALKVAVEATELEINNHTNLIPLPETTPYSAFAIIQRQEDIQAASRFFTMLAGATENDCYYGYLDESISANELDNMKDNIQDAEFLIFALYYKGRGYSKNLGDTDKINNVIQTLSDGREYITIFVGDPYIADKIPAPISIKTYSDSFASLAAAVMKITGRKMNQ